MKQTLTAPKSNDALLSWDSRPFSLTLAGCLAVAGLPLASEAVAETTPEPIVSDTAEETAPIREAFHITDEKSANWYLRKLAGIEAEKSRILAQTEKMLAELDSDKAGLKFMYEGELQEFVRAELATKGNRKKTLHLIQGTCAFRSVPAGLKLADPVAAFAHAKENIPAAIESIERLNNEEYRGCAEVLYKEFKTILPGIEKTDARESFTVKFGGKSE